MTPMGRRMLHTARTLFWLRVATTVVDLIVCAMLLWLAIFFFTHDAAFSSAILTAVAFWHGRSFPDDVASLSSLRWMIRKLKADPL